MAGRHALTDPRRPGSRRDRARRAGRVAARSPPSTASPPPPVRRPSGGRRSTATPMRWPPYRWSRSRSAVSPWTRRSSTSCVSSSRTPGSPGSTHPPRSARRSSSTTGWPASRASGWIAQPDPDRPMLSVDGDELVIRSPHHGAGLVGAVHTGDRVEFVDDRVLITGRLDTDEINVGGSKVSAGIVRNVLMGHPVSPGRECSRARLRWSAGWSPPKWCRTVARPDHRRRPGPVVLEPAAGLRRTAADPVPRRDPAERDAQE